MILMMTKLTTLRFKMVMTDEFSGVDDNGNKPNAAAADDDAVQNQHCDGKGDGSNKRNI